MSYPSSLETMLDADRLAVRGGLRVTLGSGTYGFWNGSGNLEYGGITYWQNSLINIRKPAMTMGSQAVPITIELTESKDFGITPDVLAQIENEDYKNRPVVILDFYFADSTRDLIHVEPLYEGFIDTIDHVRGAKDSKLVVHVQTKALDNHRDGYRSASHADQQMVSPGDRFFEHAGTTPFESFKVEF